MTMFRKQLKTNHEDWRNFSYSKGDTVLNFKLRIDIKSQLKDYKELLKKALDDVTEELEKELIVQGGSGFFSGGASGPGAEGASIERKKN